MLGTVGLKKQGSVGQQHRGHALQKQAYRASPLKKQPERMQQRGRIRKLPKGFEKTIIELEFSVEKSDLTQEII